MDSDHEDQDWEGKPASWYLAGPVRNPSPSDKAHLSSGIVWATTCTLTEPQLPNL